MATASEIDLCKPDCFFPEQAKAFEETVAEVSRILERDLETYKTQGFLICEMDPISVISQIAAALTRDIPIFLGNPDWQTGEWEQVHAQKVPPALNESRNCPSTPPKAGEIHIPTGGSSGSIKFARHTLSTLSAAADALHSFLGNPAIHSWSSLPAHHVSGLMPWLRALVSEGKVLFSKEPACVSRFPIRGISTTSIVGTQLARHLEQKSYESLKSYDIVFIGGSPVQKRLLDQARELEIPLAPCYGSTETAAMISCLKPELFLQGVLNAGTPLPHASLSFNEDKRIEISSPSLFLGYWDSEYNSINQSWQTDDRGELDSTGHLQILGRTDDLIITGGEKVDPQQVESTLCAIRGVQDAFILAEPHPEWGSQVTCIAKLDNSTLKPETLKELLKEKLAAYKIPKRWIFVITMPYNAQGKRDPKLISKLLKYHA